jgi:hypothetical protein
MMNLADTSIKHNAVSRSLPLGRRIVSTAQAFASSRISRAVACLIRVRNLSQEPRESKSWRSLRRPVHTPPIPCFAGFLFHPLMHRLTYTSRSVGPSDHHSGWASDATGLVPRVCMRRCQGSEVDRSRHPMIRVIICQGDYPCSLVIPIHSPPPRDDERDVQVRQVSTFARRMRKHHARLLVLGK